jgi:hypothetical protein
VKCRGGRPCEACRERNHPEICHVEELFKGSRRHPKGKAQNLQIAKERPAGSTGSETSVGELSTLNFIENNLAARERKNNTLSAMGIGNPGFPISLTTLSGSTDDQKVSAPRRAEILQYYAPFRDLVIPLYPIVPDLFSFELMIEEILRGTDAHTDPVKLAVVLSCLALGAQFTEAQVDRRWEVSQEFIARANTYLQRANSIFEPSTEVVQALLMIGIALQNLGLSNGAWNLLGLTYRCAQSLSLHKCTDNDEAGYQGAMLWTAILWQDALMSLRHDRTPLTQREQDNGSADYAGPMLQPYHDTVSKLCWVSINMLHQSTTCRCDPQYVSSKIDYIEHVVATARDHLSPLCTGRTLQKKFQYYAVRLHSSLLIAELCRPGFSNQEPQIDNPHKAIRQKGLHYLFVVVESFLELCTFSNIPFRSWSLIQAAVSCALALALIDSKRPLPGTQGLLRRFVDTLRMSDVSGVPLPSSSLGRPEVYDMSEKSANLLGSILNRTNTTSAQEAQAPAASTTIPERPSEEMINANSFDLSFDEFLSWPTELSLFDSTFSDAMLQANLHESIYNL